MADQTQFLSATTGRDTPFWERLLPAASWMRSYDAQTLSGDLLAGIVVAIMLVPQSMAYALLAGLPAQAGLYASIVPLVIYGLLGSSRVLAVGPVAMVSLLVATGISQHAEPGTANYVQLALTLALMVSVIQISLGLLRAGFLVNFLSHPVLVGFTSAVAIVIGVSQLKHLLGVEIPRTEHVYKTLLLLLGQFQGINPVTLAIGLGSMGTLVFFKRSLPSLLKTWKVPRAIRSTIARVGPLVIVLFGTLLTWRFSLHITAGITIVGDVPSGLPPLTRPTLDIAVWRQLLPIALTISLVGYMESIAIARALASKKRQKVHSNQELIALGAANIGAAFTGGYPVVGGLSRSVVNDTAGAKTGLASIITAGLIALTLVFLMPLFFFLPNAVLAAIILVAVANLIDVKAFKHTWRYSRLEGTAMGFTFAAVLILGIELGILAGVGAALSFHLWRTSRPHIAVIGRIQDTEHYRNVQRHEVHTAEQVVAVRVDESLYFPNAQYLEEIILGLVADQPHIKHLVLVCTAVNYIDTSALHMLENLTDELRSGGVQLHLAEVKGPVMDRLEKTILPDKVGREHIFLSAHRAMSALA